MADSFAKRLNDNVSVSITEKPLNNTATIGGNTRRASRDIGTSTLSQATFTSTHAILIAPDDKTNLKKSPREVMEADLETGRNYHQNVSDSTSLSIKQSYDIMSALPDLELAMRLKVCSVLSPNDMISKELIFSCTSTIFGDITKLLIDVVQSYFEDDYKIKQQLTEMLNKAMFLEGSYIKVVLPESTIDETINSNLVVAGSETKTFLDLIGTESKSHGFLGSNTNEQSKISEALNIDISDNFDLCKMPRFNQKRSKDKAYKSLFPGLLSAFSHEGVDDELSIYPKRENKLVNVLMLKNLKDIEKPSIGHPVDLTVPPEAFIPVHHPSNPSRHEGGFILLDESGNPVRDRENSDQNGQLALGHQESIDALTANLISVSNDPMLQSDSQATKKGVVDSEYMSKIYSSLLEAELRTKLDSGIHQGSGVDIGLHSEVQRVMLSRALKQMKTKLVFVPKELVSYLAFDYKDNGVGRGLIEKTKNISSMRMIQEVADAIANVRNAIDHKDATIKLDPSDDAPMKTVNDVLHNIQNTMMAQTPLGSLNMNDIAKNFQLHGWNVKTEGHEGMPDMSVEYNQSTRNYPSINTDYANRIRDQQTMSLGLSPDSLAGAFNAELATAIISNNIFLARDALDNQETFSAFLTDFIQKYTISSSILVEQLAGVIEKNRKIISANKKYSSKLLAILFINNIKIELPKPDLSKLDMQKKALDTYADMVKVVLDYFITEDSFSEAILGEEPAQAIAAVKAIILEAAVRKYISDNNIAPELFELIYGTSYQSDKLAVLKAHQNSIDHLAPVISEFITRNKVRVKKAAEKAEAINNVINKDGEEAPEASYGGEMSSADNDTNDTDADGDGVNDDEDTTGGEDGDGSSISFDDLDDLEDIDLGD